MTAGSLLGPAEIRALAGSLGVQPTKRLGQNFVVDANTVRRIVQVAEVGSSDRVLEVGPGLGSLTLGLLTAGAEVVAVEIDPLLADALPATVARHQPEAVSRLTVVAADALRVPAAELRPASGESPTALVANLPYNVAVPVLLRLLADLPSLQSVVVMVQREVAERLAAPPGSRTYGIPSVKAAWFGEARLAGPVPRSVFWPVPNVDSALVALRRTEPPRTDVDRASVFGAVDAAFGQRRKMLRSALAGWAGGSAEAARIVTAAGLDPSSRGEALTVADFAAIAAARAADPAADG